jgi:uncharacterized membrane protein
MFFRILVSSFRRSRRRKTVAFAALAIASAIWTLVLAVGRAGGCNPLPLPSRTEGGELVIREFDLAAEASGFAGAPR